MSALSKLVAVQFEKELKTGTTKPCVFQCEDSNGKPSGEYVTKLRAGVRGNEIGLQCEFIAWQLAEYFGIPHLPAALISLDEQFADAIGNAMFANVTVAYDSRSAERVPVKIVGLNGSTPHVYRASLRPRKESPHRFIEHLEIEPPQDGSIFEFTDITPGIYDLAIAFSDSDSFYVADIRQAGRSIFDSGLVIGDVARPEPVELVVGSPAVRLMCACKAIAGVRAFLYLCPMPPAARKVISIEISISPFPHNLRSKASRRVCTRSSPSKAGSTIHIKGHI